MNLFQFEHNKQVMNVTQIMQKYTSEKLIDLNSMCTFYNTYIYKYNRIRDKKHNETRQIYNIILRQKTVEINTSVK